MKKSKFSGILFDLDGTLLDTAPEFKAALNILLKEEKQSALAEDLPAHIFNVAVNNGLSGLIDLGFGTGLDTAYHTALKSRLAEFYYSHLGQFSTLFPGISECLNQLKEWGIPWAIVTNKFQKFTLPLVEKITELQQAQVIISGDTLAYSKPHPAPLQIACEKMKICPTKSLYVGDAQRDVEAARAANMPCVLATYGYLSPDDSIDNWGAQYAISQAQELTKLILC